MRVIMSILFALMLLGLYCCKRDKAPLVSQSTSWNDTFSVGYQNDSIFYVHDTLYKVSFNSGIQEGRCANLNCTGCSGLRGYCAINISVTNQYTNQVIPLQMTMYGCELEADSLDFFSINLSQGHAGFNFQIGLLAVTPYPTNYDSIVPAKYRCLFVIKNS